MKAVFNTSSKEKNLIVLNYQQMLCNSALSLILGFTAILIKQVIAEKARILPMSFHWR
jgi:hypothetical protein